MERSRLVGILCYQLKLLSLRRAKLIALYHQVPSYRIYVSKGSAAIGLGGVISVGANLHGGCACAPIQCSQCRNYYQIPFHDFPSSFRDQRELRQHQWQKLFQLKS